MCCSAAFRTSRVVPTPCAAWCGRFGWWKLRLRANLAAADATLRLNDFAFVLSGPLHAGSRTVQLVNDGRQAHELVLIRLRRAHRRRSSSRVTDREDCPIPPVGKPAV
jgi:hypothetical protein